MSVFRRIVSIVMIVSLIMGMSFSSFGEDIDNGIFLIESSESEKAEEVEMTEEVETTEAEIIEDNVLKSLVVDIELEKLKDDVDMSTEESAMSCEDENENNEEELEADEITREEETTKESTTVSKGDITQAITI